MYITKWFGFLLLLVVVVVVVVCVHVKGRGLIPVWTKQIAVPGVAVSGVQIVSIGKAEQVDLEQVQTADKIHS